MSFGERLPFIGARLVPAVHRHRDAVAEVRQAACVGARQAGRADRRRRRRARPRNTVRKPGRTAATAAALMIGIALVTFVAVLGGRASRTPPRAASATTCSQRDYVDLGPGQLVADHGGGQEPRSKSVAGVTAVQGIREDNAQIGKDEARASTASTRQASPRSSTTRGARAL